jgi:hypothetical protein
MPDESRILRDRFAAMDDAFDASQAGGEDYGSAALLVQTIQLTTYPTTAQTMYACNPVNIDGDEIEGGVVTYIPDTNTVVFILNVGSAIPPLGTRRVASGVGGRWTFQWDG